MKDQLIDLLCCPFCHNDLFLRSATKEQGEIKEGNLYCQKCSKCYPIINFVPRFVSAENYSKGFGFQWNRFHQVQLDKINGTTLSADRFYRQSGWNPLDLREKLILEAGCGAGRFTQVCLDAGAVTISVDYSTSVDAVLKNYGLVKNLHLLQADIGNLPLRSDLFERIFCFGVLQHTPWPRQTFLSLPKHLSLQGQISIDIYRRGIWDYILPKHYLRILTTRLDYQDLFHLCENFAPKLLPISDVIGAIPTLGRYLRRMIPIANIRGVAALSEQFIKDWAILDTFDMFGARYDHPATAFTVRRWFRMANLSDIEVQGRLGLVLGKGTKDR